MLQVAIAPGSGQPNISGSEGIAQMEQHRYLPEASVADRLGTKMAMPFRAGPKEAGMCGIVQASTQSHHRFEKRERDRRSPQIEQAQQA